MRNPDRVFDLMQELAAELDLGGDSELVGRVNDLELRASRDRPPADRGEAFRALLAEHVALRQGIDGRLDRLEGLVGELVRGTAVIAATPPAWRDGVTAALAVHERLSALEACAHYHRGGS